MNKTINMQISRVELGFFDIELKTVLSGEIGLCYGEGEPTCRKISIWLTTHATSTLRDFLLMVGSTDWKSLIGCYVRIEVDDKDIPTRIGHIVKDKWMFISDRGIDGGTKP